MLWPERFPKSVVEPAIKRMSAHAAAGQYQQRPTAREGGLFKRLWFDNPVKFADESRLQKVRSWDLASTEQSVSSTDPDWTVGVKMGYDPEIRVIYVLDVIRARLSPAQVETKIKTTAILDGEETSIRIPQDPGGAGKFQAAYLVGQLQGYSVSTEREDGNKESRANPSLHNASTASSNWLKGRGIRRSLRSYAPSLMPRMMTRSMPYQPPSAL